MRDSTITGAPGLPGVIPRSLTIREAANACGLSLESFRRAYEARGFPYFRPSHKIRRVPSDELDRFWEECLERREVTP